MIPIVYIGEPTTSDVIPMRWKDRRQSTNVEDRRGISPKAVAGGGIGTVVIALLEYLLGGDPSQVIDTSQMGDTESSSQYKPTAKEDELARFVSVVLAETEDV